MTDRELMQQALDAMLNNPDDISDEIFESIKALKERLAQPEQEPVAWLHNDIEGNVITHQPSDIGRHPERWTPLYTAPRQWQGLTDEEIIDHFETNVATGSWLSFADGASYAERRLKEKNT
jgi:hypothetical protein